MSLDVTSSPGLVDQLPREDARVVSVPDAREAVHAVDNRAHMRLVHEFDALVGVKVSDRQVAHIEAALRPLREVNRVSLVASDAIEDLHHHCMNCCMGV